MFLETQDGDVSVKCEIFGKWIDGSGTRVVAGIAFVVYCSSQ